MIANRPAAVAAAFSTSSRPASCGELLRGDARTDHDRGQEGGAEELGQ
jgi:hypothetical protein